MLAPVVYAVLARQGERNLEKVEEIMSGGMAKELFTLQVRTERSKMSLAEYSKIISMEGSL